MSVILAVWEVDIGRIMALGQARQEKFARPHLNGKKVGVVVYALLSQQRRKHKIGGSQSRQVWAKIKVKLPSPT
jgi:hypothetical protein